MARNGDKPYTPRFSPEFDLALVNLESYLKSIKDMPADARANAITQAFKDMAHALNRIGIIANDATDYKHFAPHTNLASTIFNYQGSTRDFPRAKAAMERLADTAALALLSTSNEDTVTRFPLNQNAVNALNSSSLLLVQNKTSAVIGIYHASGSQLSGRLEYKPVNLLQATQLLDEAIQSAERRDEFNAGIPEYAKQTLKYQDLKDRFIKATAGYTDTVAISSTAPQETQTPQNTARPGWAQYSDILQKKTPASAAYNAAYDNYWNRVINNVAGFIGDDAQLIHDQPVLLNALKGTKNWQQHLFLIKENGIPKLFLATADPEKRALFTEIDAARTLELATAGYDGDAATKAAQKFTDTLKRYEYHLPESLVSTGMSGTNNAKTASLGGRQSGYAYAAPEWLIENLPDKENLSLKNTFSKLENTLANNADAIKTTGYLMLAPAIYEIAEKTHEVYESSGAQAAANTASQEIGKLYTGIQTAMEVSPYTLPLLATPHGEIAYLASSLVAGMGGSQAMEAIENGTMYLWQKLAVEPLQAQAKERDQLKQQDQLALKQHQDVVNSIPVDPPLKRSPAETLAHHIKLNAAQNEWSLEKTYETLQAFFNISPSTSSVPTQEQLPQPATQEITGP